MAEKKAKSVSVEKIYTIPLRKAYIKSPRIEKTKKSVKAVKTYVIKHTKIPNVKISEKLNSTLWSSGAKKPLHTIRVKVTITDDVASVRLPEEITFEEEKKKFLEKKDKKTDEKPGEIALAPEEAKPEVKEEKSTEDKKEEPKAEAPVESKPIEKK